MNLSTAAADSNSLDRIDFQRSASSLPTMHARSIEVQNYTREYNVSPEEAIRRFTLLEAVPTLNYELSNYEGVIFGGLWVQHTPEFKLFINVVGNNQQVIQSYITDGALNDVVQVQAANLTLNELESLASIVAQEFAGAGVKFDYDINVPENRVEVYMTDSSIRSIHPKLEKMMTEFGSSVLLVRVDQLSRRTYSILGGYKLTNLNGQTKCTSGFTVVHSASGNKGIATAGHCGNELKYNGKRILVFQAESWSSVSIIPYDVQWHTSSYPTDDLRAYIHIGSGNRAIYGQSPRGYQYVGEYVCKYGVNSGSGCGTIVSKNFNGTYIRVHSDLADLSEPTDSGGPWYKDYTAYGIMTGDIEPGNDAYYMAIDYISILGLQLYTYPN